MEICQQAERFGFEERKQLIRYPAPTIEEAQGQPMSSPNSLTCLPSMRWTTMNGCGRVRYEGGTEEITSASQVTQYGMKVNLGHREELTISLYTQCNLDDVNFPNHYQRPNDLVEEVVDGINV